MTDYQPQYSSDPLTPMNPYQNTSNTLEINPSDNFNETIPNKTQIKKSNGIGPLFLFLIFFMVGLITTVFFIIEGMRNTRVPVYSSIFTFLFLIVGYIPFCTLTISTKIHIDNSVGIITITKRKFFCCFNESVKIQINKIEQAFIKEIQLDEVDNKYEIFFKLLNGNEIPVCEYESKTGSYYDFNRIKSALPQNIIFNSNIKK